MDISIGPAHDKISTTDTGFSSGNNDRTISLWIKTSQTGEKYFASYGTSATNQKWEFGMLSNYFIVGNNGGYKQAATNVINDNIWHHLVATHNNGVTNLYLDGINQTLTTGGSYGALNTILSGSFVIGDTITTGYYFNGTIDEVRIWNRSLSAAEVYQIYASNLQKFNSTQWYLYVNQSQNATTGLSSGAHTYFASAKDTSGNENMTETRTITVDQTPPIVTINQPLTITSSPVIFNVTTNENSACSFTLNSGVTNYTMQNNGNRDFNATNGSIADGSYTVRYYCLDSAGNLNSSATRAFTVDATAPIVTINSPLAIAYNVSSITFNVTLNENGSAALFSLNNGVTNYTMQNNGNRDFNATNGSIADGSYNVLFYVNDSIGNLNSSAARAFTVDTTVPLISYGTGTETDGSNITRNNIYVNVSVTELSEANITFSLYNLTSVFNSTTLAALASARNSVGYEIDKNFKELIEERVKEIKDIANERNEQRIKAHLEFIKNRFPDGGEKYTNKTYNFPVVTSQETNLAIPNVKEVIKTEEGLFEAEHHY